MAQPDGQHLGTLWTIVPHEALAVAPRTRAPVYFAHVGVEAVEELAQAMDLDGPEEVAQRFVSGRQCAIVRVEGKLVAYGWISFEGERIGELGLGLHLHPGEAYIWGCATLPAYRGLRLYPALLAYILSELNRAGVPRVWIGADSDNVASQKGFVLVGFQPIAEIVLVEMEAQHYMRLRASPGAPEAAFEDARAMFYGL